MRKEGFYWIKTFSDRWEPAEWSEDGWWVIGSEDFLVEDTHFKEIGEEIRKTSNRLIYKEDNTAKPIRLGLVLEGEDAREFEKNMKNPKVSEEDVAFFREAIRVYNRHKF